jgi:GAF domain-containing protein
VITNSIKKDIVDLRRVVGTSIARAATDKGFIRIVIWMRFIALLFLVARFAIGSNDVIPSLIPYMLWAYLFVIVGYRLMADFCPELFDTQASRFIQVSLDLVFITVFYYGSGDLKSDVFQLYFIPLLIVARYTHRLRSLMVFLAAVTVAIVFVWFSFSNLNLHDYDNLPVWLFRLASRVGFLALFTIFYMVYQRRLRLVGNLQLAEDELLDKQRNARYAVFTVDRQLRITGADEYLQERFGSGIMGKPYFQAFGSGAKVPPGCPLTVALSRKRHNSSRLSFKEPLRSAYPVEIAATPILSKTKNAIGATALVLNLQQQEAFEEEIRTYATNVEFALDEASLNYESWAADKTRQLSAIIEATAAVLSPDQQGGVKKILQAMAELLRCQLSDLRLSQVENGRLGLVLSQAYGYDLSEGTKWRFVDADSSSIAASAFKQRGPFQVYDVQREPNQMQFVEKAMRYGLHSAAAFPLMAPGKLIGTVSMYRQRRLVFSEDELELGQAFANSLAVTIYNQQLVEQRAAQAKLQVNQVTALSEISRQLPVRKDVTTLAHLITDFTKEHLQAEVAALFLLQEDHLTRKAISGVENTWFQDETYAKGQGLTGRVLRDAEPVCVNNVDTNREVVHEHLRRYEEKLLSRRVKHLLAVPLIGQDGLIGVLRVLNRLDGNAELSSVGFSGYDQDLLTIISHSVAVSIQGTHYAEEQEQLFDQQRRRATNLLKLNNRAAEFTATSSYDETANHVASGFRDLLNCDIAGLGIYERRTKEIRALPNCGIVGVAQELIPQLRFAVDLSGGEVLRCRKIFKTSDVSTDPDSIFGQELPALVKARAIMAVPLYVGERDVGVLYAAQREPRHFSQEEEQLCEIYARQAAVAIRNTELLNELNRRVAMLESLGKSASYASERDVLPEVLHVIAEGVNQAVGADISFIAPFSISEARLDIDLSVTAGDDGNYKHRPSIRQSGLTKKALDSLDGYYIVENYKHYPPEFASEFVRTNNITSAIAVRLEFKRNIVGVLYVNFYKQHHFSEENIETLRLLAVHIAMAIHTFNLIRRNQEIAKERERERLREDMHSVLGSFHSRIMFGVERIHKQIALQGESEYLPLLDRLWDSSSSIYRQMEQILSDMRDPVLAERGLKVALEGLAQSYQEELKIKCQVTGDCPLSPDVELALYRITQECIHNIVKHAGLDANQDNSVSIQLDLDSPIPRLLVQDYGKGFDVWQVKQVGNGMGLKMIGNWTRRIQATLDVKSGLGKGTIVCVSILDREALITR